MTERAWDELTRHTFKMAFGIYSLLEACLLLVNAVAVLHEERFLAKVGWGNDQLAGFGEERGVKHQMINLIHSVRTVMRIPLIFLNVITMVLLLLMG